MGEKGLEAETPPWCGVRLAHSYFSAIGEGAQSEGWRWEGRSQVSSWSPERLSVQQASDEMRIQVEGRVQMTENPDGRVGPPPGSPSIQPDL